MSKPHDKIARPETIRAAIAALVVNIRENHRGNIEREADRERVKTLEALLWRV